MGPVGSHETSVSNNLTPRNNPEYGIIYLRNEFKSFVCGIRSKKDSMEDPGVGGR